MLGTWHGLYFLHGWGKIGVVPQLAIMFSGWMLSLALLVGYHPQSWLGWLWLAFLTCLLGSAIYLGIMLFGRWDLGKGGSRKITLLRDFEKNPASLIIFDSLFDAIKTACNPSKLKLHPKWLQTADWIKEKRKELSI